MNARMVLAEMTKKIGYDVERVPSLQGLDAKVQRLETPYVYFELPGDNTAKGRSVERCVVVGGGTARIPMEFPRQVRGKTRWLILHISFVACIISE